MSAPFVVTVRSGPTKVATIECVRLESGVKLLSIAPVKGPTPFAGDVVNHVFSDVAAIRAAVRRRWSRDPFKLMSRIQLNPRIQKEFNLASNEQVPLVARFVDGQLVVQIDDGNAIVEKILNGTDWTWVVPSDAGLRLGA